MSGWKVPTEDENPIDVLFVNIGEQIAEPLHKSGHTPNIITTYSVIARLISIYYFVNDSYKLSALFYLIGHFFDDLDGYMARKYKQTSEIGELYDHVTDVIFTFIIIVLLLNKIKHKKEIIILGIILLSLQFIHIGYCESTKKDKTDTIFNIVKNISCSKDIIHIIRWFGAGTNAVIFAILIAFANKI